MGVGFWLLCWLPRALVAILVLRPLLVPGLIAALIVVVLVVHRPPNGYHPYLSGTRDEAYARVRALGAGFYCATEAASLRQPPPASGPFKGLSVDRRPAPVKARRSSPDVLTKIPHLGAV
jgi:hypothetical protein